MLNLFRTIKVRATTHGSHGDHWSALYGFNTMRQTPEFLLEKIKEDVTSLPVVEVVQGYSIRVNKQGPIELWYISERDNQLMTTFPVLRSLRSIPFTTKSVTEWRHMNSVEGQINGAGRELFGLNMFAADYLKEKKYYRSTEHINVSVTAFVYELNEASASEGKMAKDFVGYLPYKECASNDVIQFIGEVLTVTSLSINGKDGFVIGVKLINHPDIEDCFTIDMFVGKNNMEVPNLRPGSRVSGIAWLQCRLTK